MDYAILEHKLIVPAHLVPLNALDAFTVTLKNDDGEPVDHAFYHIDYVNNLYYFERGNLGLIYQIFGHLEIKDNRSVPRMESSDIVTPQGVGLQFTASLRENQKDVADFLVTSSGYGQLNAHPRFGKTVVMTNVTCRLGVKTLFLSHQIDLAQQAYEKFLTFTNMNELEEAAGKKVVGLVDKWKDLKDLDVAIMPYQKFISGKNHDKWLRELRNQFGLIFVDECFEYTTKVTLHNGQKIYIGRLVSEFLKGINFHVMSFNNENKSWESKRVTGYSKKKANDDWYNIQVGLNNILCSGNHGWYLENYVKVEAKDLKEGDKVITIPQNSGRVSYSGLLGDWQKQLIYGGIIGDNCIQATKNRARIKIVHGRKQEKYYEYKESILSNIIRSDSKNYTQGYSKVGTLSNNTLSTKEILEIKNEWDSNPRKILNKMDDRAWAFAFMDNGSCSQSTARLHINSLNSELATIISNHLNEEYNINTQVKDYKGSTITFGVNDYRPFFEKIAKYFHPSMLYKLEFVPEETVLGYCDNLSFSLEEVKSITRNKVKSKSPNMYNIEVEDNHNYLVGSGYLVSNCHRLKAEGYSHVVSSLNSAWKYGVSGTTELKKDVHLLNDNIIGPVVMEGHGDQLPCTVVTYNTGINVPLRPGKMFFTMMHNYLANHDGGNKMKLSVMAEYLKAGHTIIAVTDRTKHCDWFTQELKNLGYTAESYHAKTFTGSTKRKKEKREEMLNRIRSGETRGMIAMRSMVLGLDVPRATAFFNLLPTAHPQNYFQEFSRVRTPWEENGFKKEMGYIIDFRDNHHILKACYKTRRKEYERNGFHIYDDLSDEGGAR